MKTAEPLRILVVDDNKDAADSLSMLLRMWGYDARPIYDGTEAIPAAYAYKPDCIVTDIGMPGMNGYQLAETVRREKAFKGMTLIAISAFADPGRVKAAGFDHLLLKPADPDAVQAIVRRLQSMERRLEEARKLSEQQSRMILDATAVMKEVKEDVKEIKEELREVKENVKEIKEELREVKEEKCG